MAWLCSSQTLRPRVSPPCRAAVNLPQSKLWPARYPLGPLAATSNALAVISFRQPLCPWAPLQALRRIWGIIMLVWKENKSVNPYTETACAR